MIDIPPEPPQSSEIVIEQRLVECGLSASEITITYDDDIQNYSIDLGVNSGANESKFPCIHEASEGAWVEFEDRSLLQAYQAYEIELHRPAMNARLRDELASRGLLDGFPQRSDFATLVDFIRALEAHAGFEPGSHLSVTGNQVTLIPSADEALWRDNFEAVLKLVPVVAYASLTADFELGFIGYEHLATDKSR